MPARLLDIALILRTPPYAPGSCIGCQQVFKYEERKDNFLRNPSDGIMLSALVARPL